MPSRLEVAKVLCMRTQDLHQMLEAQSVFARLMTDDVSREDYVSALKVLRLCYATIEPELTRAFQYFLPNYAYLKRLPLLDHDLAVLREHAACANFAMSAGIQSLPQLLGTLYVIEGSTLGGQILMRHLTAKLELELAGALSFYGISGELAASHWRQIQTLLTENIRSEAEVEAAVEAARQTFLMFMNSAKK